MAVQEENPVSALQRRLEYEFGDEALLLQTLTHRSFGHEQLANAPVALRDNERLEFLGDAILDLIISDILLEAFPNAQEGTLTKMRASVVNERTLAKVARKLHIGPALRLGRGEDQTGGREKDSILSSTFEALVAGIYLDGGFSVAYTVIRRIFAPFFVEERKLNAFYDHKTQLQELVQAQWKVTPSYHLIQSSGPDHAKTFEVEVRMRDRILARAQGSSKKEAEQGAARIAVERLGQVES